MENWKNCILRIFICLTSLDLITNERERETTLEVIKLSFLWSRKKEEEEKIISPFAFLSSSA
jgi:hypothetical protein